jgi:uncharacterized protein (UPF0276 family)
MRLGLPDLGVGVGLRIPHYRKLLDQLPSIDWFEIISENFMVEGGKPLYFLDQFRSHYPLVMHGVSLSLGSEVPLDRDYLGRLKALARRVNPPWISDHLCWTGVPGANLHDLLPLPYTEEVVRRVAERVREVQDFLEIRFAVENVSSYLSYSSSTMTEWEFVREICERADCALLFDVNNVYVSSYNHGFDAEAYVDGIPHERVVQMHLAGHTDRGRYKLDTHSDHVASAVWDLYRRACRRIGPCSTLSEWDDDIPELEVLLSEAELARTIRSQIADAREEGKPRELRV